MCDCEDSGTSKCKTNFISEEEFKELWFYIIERIKVEDIDDWLYELQTAIIDLEDIKKSMLERIKQIRVYKLKAKESG